MKSIKEQNKKSWDPKWDQIFSSQEWGKYPSEHIIQFIARNFYKINEENRKHIKILEVGCGTGANLWFIAREGFSAFGVDGSEVGIEKARKRMSNEGLDVSLNIADIIDLPFPDMFFDAVIDNECIYSNSYENSDIIMKEIFRTMKSDGMFYSRTFSDSMYIGNTSAPNINLEYSNVSSGPLEGKGFVRLSSRETIKSLYGKYFKILSIDYSEYSVQNGANVVHEWNIICKK